MKVAIYYRVSTDKQETVSQRYEVEMFLNKMGYNPAEALVYTDKGISGKTMNRPALQQMIADAKSGKFDTLVVYKLDRLSRSSNSAIRLLLDLDDIGIVFFSATQPALNLGRESPFRRTMLSIFAEVAEIERQTIVERVNSGLKAAKERGVVLGRPKEISEEQVNKMVKMKLVKGMTNVKIADEMNVSLSTVKRALKVV